MTMPHKRPLVFIGCSKEVGREIAKAIQAELQHTAECVIWWQGVFGLSEGNLESLVKTLDKYDFAILALTPDDLISSRGETLPAPRDNVLLELGMFIGGLGRDRTFMVVNRSGKLKVPSDLAGITPASFEPPVGGTLQSALGPACTDIGNAIRQLGSRHPIPLHVKGFFFQSISGSGIGFKITNLETKDFPPYKIGLFHPKLGSYFFFPSEKSGPLLRDQTREHRCMLGQDGPSGMYFPPLDHDHEGKKLDSSDENQFALRFILEDSERILYENKRVARGLVKLLRLARQTGVFGGGGFHDWMELDNELPDE